MPCPGKAKDRGSDIEAAVALVETDRDLAKLCEVMRGYRPNGCGLQKKRLRDGAAASSLHVEEPTTYDLPRWLAD